jgi:HAE1 family hydrophobic/amphiphilic exporter-1
MSLTRLSVFHPVIAITVALAIVLAGIVSYLGLGLEQTPQLSLPVVTVQVTVSGASPSTVEEQVTRKIEDAVAGLGNIRTLSSISRNGLATVTIEFDESVDVNVAVNDVQQRVSGVQQDFPIEAESPSYLKLDLNDTPVLYLAVTSDGPTDETRRFRLADETVRKRLETVDGVGRVVVVGGREPEVEVEILPDRLRAYNVTIDEVGAAVTSQFLSTSGGDVKSGTGDASRQASVRIDSRTASPASLGEIRVTAADGFSTELRNLANVYLGGKEAEEIVRLNGRPAVGLQVYKQTSANIVQTVDAVLPLVQKLNGELPPGYHLEVAADQSTSIRTTVAGVEEELGVAVLIAGAVLFLFLHSFRATLIVLVAIPMSFLIALIVMRVLGMTLNTMTLIGLVSAVGILVDDSIVVLENIFGHLEKGKESKQAAIDGRSEIGLAAIAITMVDVAVWGPIIFITGISGAFLRNFSIVIVAAALASLLVSFTLTPLIASRWLSGAGDRSLLARIAAFWEPAYRLLERAYRLVLHWALRHRPVVVVVALSVFGLNFLILPRIPTEFIPENNGEIVSVIGELPPGTALDAADLAAKRWELAIFDRARFPEIHSAFVLVGQGEAGSDHEPRFITVTLDVGGGKSRNRTSRQIADAVAAAGEQMTPTLQARPGGTGTAGQPVQLRVFGDDLGQLGQAARTVQHTLNGLPQVSGVTNSMAAAPEVTLVPDSSRLADLGVSALTVGDAVRIAYLGVRFGRWAEPGGIERDVRVRLPEGLRYNPDAIATLPLTRRGDRLVTVGQVTTPRTADAPTSIRRVDRQRIALIGAQNHGVPLGTATAAVTATMNGLRLEPGQHWEYAGQASDQQDSFTQLGLGLAASVVMMFLLLSILYENWLQPLLIQTALPLATVGAMLGLLVFHQNLGIAGFVGIIALFGMVGKNSILLVDRANDLRRQGLDRTAALEQAGDSRLRPILMTSVVLILSMLPVALLLGEGGESRAPLGAVLVGGMATSTFLSLLYVPVAYTYFDTFGRLVSALIRWHPRWPGRRAATAETSVRAPDQVLLPVAGGAPDVDVPTRAQRRPSRWLRRWRNHHRPASHRAHGTDGPADRPV